MPTGAKLLLVLVLVLAVSLLPATWFGAAVASATLLLGYLLSQLGLRPLGRQLWALRWILLITVVTQLVFLGVESAVATSARIAAAVCLAGLLTLSTQVTALLDTLERGMRPFDRLGWDSARAALLLAIAFNTIPVLLGLAQQVREAQLARGGRLSLRAYAVPLLIVSLKHADDLGDALSARGVR